MEKGFRYELALIISATSNCVIKLIKRIRSVHEGSNALGFRFSLFITSSSCTERKEKQENQQDNSEWVFWLTFHVDKDLNQKKSQSLIQGCSATLWQSDSYLRKGHHKYILQASN